MKVLFIGGTGIISSACSRLAIERGIDLYHLNRGQSSEIRPVEGAKGLKGDIRDFESARAALAGHEWDAVVDWVAFVPDHLRTDLALFRDRTRQFVFISSASAYQSPPARLPITEETPLENPFWEYSRNKIACERFLEEQRQRNGFPYTIVRPSHTYDKTLIPCEGGYTAVKRMLAGKPVVVHGDGSSIWTLTHHTDFAKGFVGLLGNSRAIEQAYHITSDEWLTWNQIYAMVADAFGVEAKFVHIPTDVIGRYNDFLHDSLLGDKAASSIFDNSKIKALVPDFVCTTPFAEGVQEMAAYYKAHPERGKVDATLDAAFDKMLADWPF